MKPRTKLHFRIVALSETLIPITEKQRKWAFDECMEHKGFSIKKHTLCLDCGNTFSNDLVFRKRATCPHCNTKLVIENRRHTTDKQTNYFAISNVLHEFQIIRLFEIIAYYKKGLPVKIFLHEIMQHWYSDEGKHEFFGKKHTLNWYCDSWNGTMEIRDKHDTRKYDVYPYKYHPDSEFKDQYSKFGINYKLQGATFHEAKNLLPNSSKAETLLKSGQFDLFGKCFSKSYAINFHWNTLKISLRNKYKIKDCSMYLDYLDLLSYFKKDLHNPKFICPKNLKKEHDFYLEKKRTIRQREEAERARLQEIERKRVREYSQKQYVKDKGIFFGLIFKHGNIEIKVLESIKEFKKEADILKHCVYENKYFAEVDSLILSASVDNVPTETIEFSLKQMKVLQSRGLKNYASKFNKEILSVFNRNIGQIEQIIKQNSKHAA